MLLNYMTQSYDNASESVVLFDEKQNLKNVNLLPLTTDCNVYLLLFYRDVNIMDNIMALIERHAENLEALVEERTRLLMEEKKKTDKLLYKMLPV